MPRLAGTSRKYSRALRTPYLTRTAKKLMTLNLNQCFGGFRGSLGDLRVLILMTVALFLVRHQEVEDYLCFQQADKCQSTANASIKLPMISSSTRYYQLVPPVNHSGEFNEVVCGDFNHKCVYKRYFNLNGTDHRIREN